MPTSMYGALYTGTDPLMLNPGTQTMFGASALNAQFGAFFDEGNLYRNVGNPIAGNAADTTLDILAGIVVPANVFDQLGRGLAITMQGKFGGTVSGNVVISLYVNPTMTNQTVTAGVISGGQVTGGGTVLGTQALTAGAGVITASGGWQLFTQLFNFGAATQWAQSSFVNSVASTVTHTGMQAPVFPTLPVASSFNLVCCASSSNSTANEVLLNFFEVNAMN